MSQHLQLKVSKLPLWLGCWVLGGKGFGPHNESSSLSVINQALEYGITHFDTAYIYSHGGSDQLLKKALKHIKRQNYFLSSKGGLNWKGNSIVHSGDKESLTGQLHESLKRLNTDYLDLFQLHWPDPKVDIKESINTLKLFKEQGLIRHWGVGNLSTKDLSILCTETNIPHQVHHNPIHRSDVLLKVGKPYTLNCVYSPLEQGLLVHPPKISKKDLRQRNPYFKSNPNGLDRYYTLTKELRVPRSVLIWLWCLAQDNVDILILGPRTVEQVKDIPIMNALLNKVKLNYENRNNWSKTLEDYFGVPLWSHLNNGFNI